MSLNIPPSSAAAPAVVRRSSHLEQPKPQIRIQLTRTTGPIWTDVRRLAARSFGAFKEFANSVK